MVQNQGKKFKHGLCSLVLCLLAGCAAKQIWVHPDHPGSSVELDYLFCETNARNEASRPQAQPPIVNLMGLAGVIRMMNEAALDREYESEVRRLLGECLQKKGWRLKEAR